MKAQNQVLARTADTKLLVMRPIKHHNYRAGKL